MIDFTIAPDELVVDNFAGGGGASVGIEKALGRSVDIAINHDPEALAMHAANHPGTRHLCENVWDVDILKETAGRRVGLAWFSPDCTHHSKARGGKPVKKEIRGLAWVVLRWAAIKRPRLIFLENVEEFVSWGPVHKPVPDAGWGRRKPRCKTCGIVEDGKPCPKRKGQTFKRWLTQLRNLGYEVDHRELRACDFGAPTIRKRLFLVARCDGQPIVWPEATHGKERLPYRTAAECIDWSLPCPSIFLSREEGRRIGVNRPLADATMRRIAKGIKRYVLDAAKPFIVNLTHNGGRVEDLDEPMRTVTGAHRGEKAVVIPHLQMMSQGGRNEPADEPMRTVCTEKGGARAIIVPTLIQTGYGERPGQEPRVPGLDKPLGTAVAGGVKHALVSAVLAGVGGRMGQSPERSVETPLQTVTSKADTALAAVHLSKYYGEKRESDVRGAMPDEPLATQPTENRHAVVAAFLAQHNTGRVGHHAEKPLSTITMRGTQQQLVAANLLKMRGTNVGSAAAEPLHTISASGTHHAEVRAFLLKYYGTDQDPRLEEPLHSLTTEHRFGLVMVFGELYEIVDIGMRMLSARELFRAQGFPNDYQIERGVRICAPDGTRDLFPVSINLTKTAQVRMCGNSVSPHPAEALIRAQFGNRKAEAA